MPKQPLALFITDTHLSENSIEVNFSVFEQAVLKCQELGIGQIFHGGDIFISRKGQPEIVLNAFHSILEMLELNNIMMFTIPGNHDKTDYTSSSSYLESFTHHKSFHLFSPYGKLEHDDIIYHFLPYYDEDLSYAEYIKLIECPVGKINILITHVGIEGILNNHEVEVKNEITPSLFDKFDLVFIGHYHNRQIIADGKIIYTGSTHQATFGEDENKGFTILYDDGSYEFGPFATPSFKTIEITGEQIDKKLLKLIKDDAGNKNRIRLQISGEYEESKNTLVTSLQELGVKVEKIKEDYVAGDVMQSETVQITSNDILESLEAWGEGKEIDLEYGRKLLQKAL
jgi:exonuclease SbcD